MFELVTARQRENCIDAIRREAVCHLSDILVPCVDRHIGAHVAHELKAVDAGCSRHHAGTAKLGELNGKRSDAA